MSNLTLYNYEMDENCYKVRLALSMLKIEYTSVPVNVYPHQEPRTPAMLALNPTGRLPTLMDGELHLFGSEAILAYLAKTYDPTEVWLPQTGAGFASVMQWLNFSATELSAAVTARHVSLFNLPGDMAILKPACLQALSVMEDHLLMQGLNGNQWFAGKTATLADIALFPTFALSRDFGIDHDEYPALRQWARRFRALPGFKTMPGIPDYH